MKLMNKIKVVLLGSLVVCGVSYGQEKLLTLEGPYLGQKPPGLTPQVFAPGIVSTAGWEISGVFTPELDEFYYVRELNIDNKLEQQFVVLKNANGRWHETVISPRVGQPFISPKGNIMHLGKRYKVRTQNAWSDIKSLGAQFEPYRIMRLTVSAKNTFVFDEATRDGKGLLRYSKLIDGKRQDPQALDKTINTGQWNAHPFIAPDESYIIWDGQRNSDIRNADLFISFQQKDGSWGEAIKFGKLINTDASESGARVSPDGKYLFFNRKVGSFDWVSESGEVEKIPNVDIFWVDAQHIEDLRPKS